MNTCHETEKEVQSQSLKDSKPRAEETGIVSKMEAERKELAKQDRQLISSFVTRSMRKWDGVEVSLFLSEIGMGSYQKVQISREISGFFVDFCGRFSLIVW
jgi:hypothetical protein